MLEKRIDDLITLLNVLHDLHRELGGMLEGKLAAMRTADMATVQSYQMRERKLTERLRERNGLRRQLMEQIGGELGIDKAAARTMGLTALAERLAEPRRGHLLVLAEQLRETLRGVEMLNKKIDVVSRVMLKHLGMVFEAMTRSSDDPGVYTSRGQRASGAANTLFSAVG